MIWFQGLAKPCRKPTLATSTHTHTNTQRKKEGKEEEDEEKYSSHKNVVVRDVDMSIEFVTNRLLPPLWLLFFNRRLQPWSTIRSYWTLNKWFPRVRHFAVIQISVSRFSVSPPIGFQHDQLFQRLRCFIRGAYSARAALLIRLVPFFVFWFFFFFWFFSIYLSFFFLSFSLSFCPVCHFILVVRASLASGGEGWSRRNEGGRESLTITSRFSLQPLQRINWW